jgi:hypothetical protein
MLRRVRDQYPQDVPVNAPCRGHVAVEPGALLRLCPESQWAPSRYWGPTAPATRVLLLDVRAPAYAGPLNDLLCVLTQPALDTPAAVSLDLAGRAVAPEERSWCLWTAQIRAGSAEHVRLGLAGCAVDGDTVRRIVALLRLLPRLATVTFDARETRTRAADWEDWTRPLVDRHPVAVWVAHQHGRAAFDPAARYQCTAGDPFDGNDASWRAWYTKQPVRPDSLRTFAARWLDLPRRDTTPGA